MNIGEASRLSGMPSKTIRYYEGLGLLRPARSDNGYRDYGEREIHVLRFLFRLRSLGFSTDEARRFLSLYGNTAQNGADCRRHVDRGLRDIDEKVAQLQSLRRALAALGERRENEPAPDCPILEDIKGETARLARRS